jgi:hypothetical protein
MKLDKMIPLLKEITHVKVGERERGREGERERGREGERERGREGERESFLLQFHCTFNENSLTNQCIFAFLRLHFCVCPTNVCPT